MTISPSFSDILSIANICGVLILAVMQDRIKNAMLTLRLEIQQSSADLKDDIPRIMGAEFARSDKLSDLARRMEHLEDRIFRRPQS